MKLQGGAGSRRPRSRRPRRLLSIPLLVSAVVLMGGTEASAHAFLVSATPAPGARLQASPDAVKLQLSEAVAGGERILVKTEGGTPIATGPIQRLQGGQAIEVSLPTLGTGVYVVSWQVVGSDGDTTLGEYAFAVGTSGPIPTQEAQSGPIAWPESAATWVLLTGLLLAFGGLASELVIWPRAAPNSSSEVPRLPVGWLLTLALAGATAQLALFAARTIGRGAQANSTWVNVVRSRPGGLAVAEIVLIGYGIWLVLVPVRWARPLALPLLGLAVIAAAARGHAGTTTTWWAGPTNVIHLLAVALWVGALAHLVLVAWRLRGAGSGPIVGRGARRYAAFAIGVVGVVLLSGAVVALSQFTTLDQLVRTTYGRILVIKSLLVVVALGLALIARRRALPGNPSPRIDLLRGLTRVEIFAVVGALAVAAVLGNAPTPRSASANPIVLGPPPLPEPVVRLAGFTGVMAVYVQAAKGQLQVLALQPGGDGVSDANIEIEGTDPSGTDIGVAPRSCGAGCVTSPFPWAQGTTNLAVSVHSGEWGGGTLQFDVSWPPGRPARGLLTRVIEAMRSQRKVSFSEAVSSGPGTGGKDSLETTGAQFIATEPYVGGAADVRLLPSSDGRQRFTVYLPGSSIWFLLVIDGKDQLRRETAVDPGHIIRRVFRYGR